MFTLKLQNIFLRERLIRAGGVEGSEAEQAGEHLPGTTPLLTPHASSPSLELSVKCKRDH